MFGGITFNTFTVVPLTVTGQRSGKQSFTDKSIDVIGMYERVYASAVLV